VRDRWNSPRVRHAMAIVMAHHVIRATLGYWGVRRLLQTDPLDRPAEDAVRPAIGLVLIPVFHEQDTIVATLESLLGELVDNPGVELVVIGTSGEAQERVARRAAALRAAWRALHRARDLADAQRRLNDILTADAVSELWTVRTALTKEGVADAYDRQPLTGDVVLAWLERALASPDPMRRLGAQRISYVESPVAGRTEQVQYGLTRRRADDGPPFPLDLVGIYDGDSQAARGSVAAAGQAIARRQPAAAQQPVHFIDAANRLSAARASPLVVANALAETSWAMFSEHAGLIRRQRYRRRNGSSRSSRSLYLQGHGQFLNEAAVETLGGFPEGGVDHGVQAGYRLSMLGCDLVPLSHFCSDDVPETAGALVRQHERWFAGSFEIARAARWVRSRGRRVPLWHLVDNIAMTFTWMLRPFVAIFAIGTGLRPGPGRSRVPGLLLLIAAGWYSYALPLLAARLTGVTVFLRPVDWLLLPVAIAFKSLGPWAFVGGRLVASAPRSFSRP
jgi:cellulose synthase/poly-beta-1,6-N-acetylglucosamine synthase-like glycosyltransferase